MKKLNLILCSLIFCLSYSACNNGRLEESDYDIEFIKSKGSSEEGSCIVLMKLPDGHSQVVDSFECRSQTKVPLLFKDISKLQSFEFGLIDTLPVPNGYGALLKKIALTKDNTITDWGQPFITFYRYYLFNNDGKIILIREQWEEKGKGIVEVISNTCLYPNEVLSDNANQQEKNGVYTRIMTYKWCECNDGCMSSFIDEKGVNYDFGDPSNKKYSFDCSMNMDGSETTKTNTYIGKQFEIAYKISESRLELISINLVGEKSENSSGSVEEIKNSEKSDRLMLRDVKIALLDAGEKKCDLLLGSPDRNDILYIGSESKLVKVYLNKVIDSDGKTKHLVLFLRDNHKQQIFVEDVKAINDGEKASFGIHWVQVNNGVVTSNSHHFGLGK